MNYQVQLNNGQVITLEGTNLDVTNFTTTLNDQSIIFVSLGGAIINKHLIQSVLPVSPIEQTQSNEQLS